MRVSRTRSKPAPKSLLCVDDNEEGLAIRKLFFETFNYRVFTATNGRKALEIIASERVDGVLLDYRMPDINGLALAVKIRRMRPDIPIVMLSGYPSYVPARVHKITNAFVTKGQPPSLLLEKVDHLLGRHNHRSTIKTEADSLVAHQWESACRRVEEQARRRKTRTEEAMSQASKLTTEMLTRSEKLALAGRLSASIAHEINNPIDSITSLLYMLEREATFTDKGRNYLSLAREELQRVAIIANQALGLYRESPKPVAVLIPELLNGILELYAPRISRKKLNVQKLYDSYEAIEGFPGELRQVFSNLIVNAVEASKEGGTIKLHVFGKRAPSDEQTPGITTTIADRGSGIPQEYRPNLFQPFFTTKGQSGTGLGLWITDRIVRRHGGKIRVRTSTRAGFTGTVFQVHLPRHAPPSVQDSPPALSLVC